MAASLEDALRAAGTAVNAAAVDAQLAVAMARARSAGEWLAIGDPAEATRVLDAALAAATSVDAVLHVDVAHVAFGSELGDDTIRDAVDRAAAIAGLLPRLAEVR